MQKLIFITLCVFTIAGCGSIYNQDAVGVGYDANELKVSPCACLKVEQKPGLEEWVLQQS